MNLSSCRQSDELPEDWSNGLMPPTRGFQDCEKGEFGDTLFGYDEYGEEILVEA